MTRLAAAAVMTVLLAGGLAGCGSGDDDAGDASSPASSSTTSTSAEASEDAAAGADDPSGGYPACEDVWVVGEQLPEGYEGCYDAERDTVEVAAAFSCKDGSELTSYQDRWWVLGDGAIAESQTDEIAADPDYGAAYSKCNA